MVEVDPYHLFNVHVLHLNVHFSPHGLWVNDRLGLGNNCPFIIGFEICQPINEFEI